MTGLAKKSALVAGAKLTALPVCPVCTTQGGAGGRSSWVPAVSSEKNSPRGCERRGRRGGCC